MEVDGDEKPVLRATHYTLPQAGVNKEEEGDINTVDQAEEGDIEMDDAQVPPPPDDAPPPDADTPPPPPIIAPPPPPIIADAPPPIIGAPPPPNNNAPPPPDDAAPPPDDAAPPSDTDNANAQKRDKRKKRRRAKTVNPNPDGSLKGMGSGTAQQRFKVNVTDYSREDEDLCLEWLNDAAEKVKAAPGYEAERTGQKEEEEEQEEKDKEGGDGEEGEENPLPKTPPKTSGKGKEKAKVSRPLKRRSVKHWLEILGQSGSFDLGTRRGFALNTGSFPLLRLFHRLEADYSPSPLLPSHPQTSSATRRATSPMISTSRTASPVSSSPSPPTWVKSPPSSPPSSPKACTSRAASTLCTPGSNC
jgi:hypothetical protein